jgi:CPA2 family monovalent cation:H+ antiporter-2
MHGHGFVQDLAIVLGVAAVTGLLFRLLKQPSVLGYLLAGLLVGPYLSLPLFADPGRVQALSEFGVVLVMFAVGLEFRISKFLRVLPISGVTGAVEIGVLLWAGFALGHELGWTSTESLFLGASICISSTMAVSKILDQQPVPKDSRELVFGVLVLQDVAAIALIAVMTAVAQGSGASFGSVLGILAKLVGLLVALVAVGMFVVPRLVRVLVRIKSPETLVVGATGLCFSFALLAEALGYSGALGAFIAGILVAESGEGTRVEHNIQSVRDVFAAVFFVSVGMTVDPSMAMASLPIAGLVIGVILVGQLLSVSLGGILSGSGVRRSVTAGLALGQIGEFAFIIAAIGKDAGVVRPELQPVLVTVAVLTTFTTSVAVRYRDPVVGFVDRMLPARLRHLLTLYEVWFEELRARGEGRSSPEGRAIRAIALDLVGIVLLVLVYRTWSKEVGHGLAELLGMPASRGPLLGGLAALVLIVPLLAALTLSARNLSLLAAQRVLGEEPSDSARALLRASVALLIVLCIGVPAGAALRTMLGITYVWPALGVAFTLAGAVAWRQAGKLDDDIRSGGEFLVRAIAKQSLPEQAAPARGSVLPGLTNMKELALPAGAAALGKTLAELRLRSVTGAAVLAIRRADQSVTIPTGTERLAEGDVLFLTGTRVDQGLAEAFLLRGEVPESAERTEPTEPAGA